MDPSNLHSTNFNISQSTSPTVSCAEQNDLFQSIVASIVQFIFPIARDSVFGYFDAEIMIRNKASKKLCQQGEIGEV